MNKKGVIAVIIVIILIVLGISLWGGSDTTVSNQGGTNSPVTVPEGVTKDTYAPVTKDTTDTSLVSRLKSASVSAAETGNRVALVNGSAKFTEGSVKGTITLGDIAVEKEVGGTKYVLTSLGVNSGGASTYQYVVLFEDNGSLSDKSYAYISDRAKITGIRGDSVTDASGKPQLVVSVTYTEQNSTAARTKILVVENGMFNPAKEINL